MVDVRCGLERFDPLGGCCKLWPPSPDLRLKQGCRGSTRLEGTESGRGCEMPDVPEWCRGSTRLEGTGKALLRSACLVRGLVQRLDTLGGRCERVACCGMVIVARCA